MKSKFDESIEITKSNYKSDSTVLAICKKIIKLIDEDCKYEIVDNQIRFYDQYYVNYYNFHNSNLESAMMFAKIDVSKRKFEKLKEKSSN